MKIRVLTTGGTIDKVYSLAGELQIGPPTAPGILSSILTPIQFVVETICAKDSRDLGDDDRASIRASVESAPESLILITHGSDTMTATANQLRGIAGKVVVLTGAMQPARMQGSDAAFNLGLAVGALQQSEPGIYIAMSGQLFAGHAVRKDHDTGMFRGLDD